MKKIQLSDGMPSDIQKSEVPEKVKNLINATKKLCKDSGLSYVEINKALYLADKELYMEKISS